MHEDIGIPTEPLANAAVRYAIIDASRDPLLSTDFLVSRRPTFQA